MWCRRESRGVQVRGPPTPGLSLSAKDRNTRCCEACSPPAAEEAEGGVLVSHTALDVYRF